MTNIFKNFNLSTSIFDKAFTHYINVLLCAYIDYSYMYGVGFKSFEFEIHISKDLNEH